MIAHQIRPRPLSLEKPVREPKYLKWLKTQPCGCGCQRYRQGRMHAAHTGSQAKGTAVKGHDSNAIPLLDECHLEYHRLGEKRWAIEREVDLRAVRSRLRAKFLRRRAA